MRGNTDQVLLALAWFDRPVYVREIASGLDLPVRTVRSRLRLLRLLGWAEAGPRSRGGRLWSLTGSGMILAARYMGARDA